jgi:hypothetical protein
LGALAQNLAPSCSLSPPLPLPPHSFTAQVQSYPKRSSWKWRLLAPSSPPRKSQRKRIKLDGTESSRFEWMDGRGNNPKRPAQFTLSIAISLAASFLYDMMLWVRLCQPQSLTLSGVWPLTQSRSQFTRYCGDRILNADDGSQSHAQHTLILLCRQPLHKFIHVSRTLISPNKTAYQEPSQREFREAVKTTRSA